MSSWNIILCGDLPNTIVVSVTDPAKWTVDDLKQLVIKDVPKATKSDITFYASSNKQLPEGVPLKDCDGVRNGTGLLTSIKPFIIKVYSPDVDGTITVEIPLLEFDDWKINTLLEVIHFKLCLENLNSLSTRRFLMSSYSIYMLVFNGQSLSNNDPSTAKVSLIPGIYCDCLMTYTKFNVWNLSVPETLDLQHNSLHREVMFPRGMKTEFAESLCFYNRNTNGWLWSWKIVIQQLDGSKTTLTLRDPHKMSVIDLRKVVEQELSIPLHQQKLLLSDDVVLEDWKTTSDGGYDKTLITDYPSFCDGAKLYIVQLIGGIRVNVSKLELGYLSHVVGSMINIHDHSLWTLQKLSLVMKALAKFYLSNEVYLYVEGTTGVRQATPKSFSQSDELVSSVDWITDNCTLTFDKIKV